jgi:hypothetical protein
MNVLEIDKGCTGYPEHDHTKDGQGRVYVILRGSATPVPAKSVEVAVGQVCSRRPRANGVRSGADGVTLLAIGATPSAFTPAGGPK